MYKKANWFDKYGGWLVLLVILALVVLFVGCASNKQYDLLHREELKNLAYKSITIKDILGEKEFN